MARVRDIDSNRSTEAEWIRKSIQDGMHWAGMPMLCRQTYLQEDFEQGRVEHCPDCWDEVFKQTGNSRCPSCYGTGYKGGYQPVFMTWCTIAENSPADERYEKAGQRKQQNMELKLPVDHIFRDGDLFVEIRRMVGDKVTELGRVMRLEAPIQYKTLQGLTSTDYTMMERDTRPEDMLVSQSGQLKLLLPSDVIYESSEAFWGVTAEPYVTEEKVCANPTEEYARVVDGRHTKDVWWA